MVADDIYTLGPDTREVLARPLCDQFVAVQGGRGPRGTRGLLAADITSAIIINEKDVWAAPSSRLRTLRLLLPQPGACASPRSRFRATSSFEGSHGHR